MTGLYSVGDSEQRFRLKTAGAYDLDDAWDLEMLAEAAGKDFYDHHDGWEYSWPLTISLYADETGPALAHFEVEQEAVPEFTARRTAEQP